ncbi:MAG: GTPase [Planctomycetota bacterium]
MRLLTPRGLAGVAVLAVEPAEREAVLACLRMPSGLAPKLVAGGPPLRVVLTGGGPAPHDDPLAADIDDVLVLQDRQGAIELHVHGSPMVLERLRERFTVEMHAASRGPAEQLLRDAMSVEQLALACEQRAFDFAAELGRIAGLAADAERSLCFAAARQRSEVARALVEPQRVVLVGRQNAGKSTLFNRLLFRERALTGDVPGLTRDAIAECTTLQGYPYELVDTAGEGHAATDLDQAAIESGRRWRDDALVVFVVDGAAPFRRSQPRRNPPHGNPSSSAAPQDAADALYAAADLVVRNKSDLAAVKGAMNGAEAAARRIDAQLSARDDSPASLRERVGKLLQQHRGLPAAGPVGGFAALDEAQRAQLAAAAASEC